MFHLKIPLVRLLKPLLRTVIYAVVLMAFSSLLFLSTEKRSNISLAAQKLMGGFIAPLLMISASPSLEVVTTSKPVTPVNAGQTIDFLYVVRNTGNVAVLDIKVDTAFNGSGQKDEPHNEYIAVDVAPLGDSADTAQNDGVWTTLGSGDSVAFTSTYIVSQADLDTLQGR